jgi:hypothetical protein
MPDDPSKVASCLIVAAGNIDTVVTSGELLSKFGRQRVAVIEAFGVSAPVSQPEEGCHELKWHFGLQWHLIS